VSPYDQIAGDYRGLFSGAEFIREDEEVFDLLCYQGGSVLDIGCGAGLFLDYVNPDEYLGIDPSIEMLDKLLGRYPDEVAFWSSFEKYVPESRFDLVVSLYGSMSYVNPTAIGKLHRSLSEVVGRYFLMFYKPGYAPTTHAHIKNPPPIFDLNMDLFPGATVVDFSSYSIIRGGR
jgi:SAM-dependent methyltransferase